MSLKHAILGFLSFKSLTGYGLKKAFDRSVQHFGPGNQSQIYRELAALHCWLSTPLPVQSFRGPYTIPMWIE